MQSGSSLLYGGTTDSIEYQEYVPPCQLGSPKRTLLFYLSDDFTPQAWAAPACGSEHGKSYIRPSSLKTMKRTPGNSTAMSFIGAGLQLMYHQYQHSLVRFILLRVSD